MSLAPASPERAATRAASGAVRADAARTAVELPYPVPMRPSLLAMPAAWRLAGAGVLCAALWAAVAWALG